MRNIYFVLLILFSIVAYSQNVGIGTASPGARLDINGPATGSGITLRVGGGGDAVLNSGGSVFFDGNYSYASGNYIRPIAANTQAFFTTGVERMRITPTGNVGIGITSVAPIGKLEIAGGADFNGVGDQYSLVFQYRTGGYRHFMSTRHNSGNGGNAIDFYLNNSSTPGGSSSPGVGNLQVLTLNIEDGWPKVGIGIQSNINYALNVKAPNEVTTGIFTNGYAEDVSGIIQGNYVPSHSWNAGTGNVGIFTMNGPSSENQRVYGATPYNAPGLLWRANGFSNDADGGWDTQDFSIDHTKTYRVSVWVKRTGANAGNFYLGCGGTNITTLSGTPDANPYFYFGSLPDLNKWYLVVGYIHSSSDASTTHYGGVYDGETGKKVISFNGTAGLQDYKFTSSAAIQRHRSYLYYNNNNPAVNQFFYDPRFEEVNGKEMPIAAMLALSEKTVQKGYVTDMRPYGTPSYIWDGMTSPCISGSPILGRRGGATIDASTYCNAFGTGWNNKNMVTFGNLSTEAQNTTTIPGNGIYMVVPATPGVHNNLLISTIDNDRWSCWAIWLCNPSYTSCERIARTVNNTQGGNASTYVLGPYNNMKETNQHAWLNFPISKAKVDQYINGGNLYLLAGPGVNNQNGGTLFMSGLAMVPNPYGLTQNPALNLHWGLNGNATGEMPWNNGSWNNEGLAQVSAYSTSTVSVKIVDPSKDLLVTFLEHNGAWSGGSPYVTVGSNGTVFRPSQGLGGISDKLYTSDIYRRPQSFIIPASIVSSQVTTSSAGVPNILRLNINNRGALPYHIRGIDTQIVE